MGLDYIRNYNQRQQAIYAAKTGFFVDIQKIGKNNELIAVKERKSNREIKPGVWLKKQAVRFKDGNFTNIYDLYWNPQKVTILPKIHSSNEPYSLLDQIENDPSILGVINGSFYFLADNPSRTPHDLPYNFCIRDGKLLGLPSSDEPVMYITNNTIHVKEVKAKGKISIGKSEITWVGAHSSSAAKNTYDATLYNSKSSIINVVHDKRTNVQIELLDSENITTPKQKNVTDLSICYDEKGKFRIAHVKKGGGTHFYNGAFVLQIKGVSNNYRIKQIITLNTLDRLDLEHISSGFTIGRSVIKPNPDMLKNSKRDARTIIAKDNTGNIHFMVFDGSKYIPGFNGVSRKDITPFFSPEKYAWAYFLDGGGSSRIIVKEERKLHVLANQFAFQKVGRHHVWDWHHARNLASSISLRMLEN